ncbi:hypothetical protein HMPREF3239_05610 [Staphylococcus sp. HMSC34C02]|nr:hypothetical protein HMPREF3239_05610 [Staphylococcus sp. HMSC34C02]RIO79959.1 hypothetical protein BUZ39_15895 [Staphylococcus haemolyticus]
MSKSKLRLILNIIYFGSIILLCIFMWITDIHILTNIWGIILFWTYIFIFQFIIDHYAPKQKKHDDDK